MPVRIRLLTPPAAADAAGTTADAEAATVPALEQQAENAAPEPAAQAVTDGGSSRRRRSGRRGQGGQQGTEGKPTAPASSSSSSFAEAEVVIVTSTTNTTSTAAFMAARLCEEPGAELRLNPAGPQAGANALKLLAKADQQLAKNTDGSSSSSGGPQLVFRTERRLLRLGSGSTAEYDGAEDRQITVNAMYVWRVAAGSLSADLPEGNAAMLVRTETEPDKITRHVLYSLQRSGQAAAAGASSGAGDTQQQQQPVAALVLMGSYLPVRVKLLLRGLSIARKQLRDEGKQDLMFTVQRSVQELTEEELQRWQERRPEQQQDQGTPAKAIYTVSAYVCKPRGSATRAASRRKGSSSSSSERPSSSARRGGRPGYVEVPAAEWAALREQLEVVPHLTQQLQTLTCQHEQLLSLLAAQGGPAGPAAAAAAAAEPEQE
jgi:hypothetical protein